VNVHFYRVKRKHKYGDYDDEGGEIKDMKRSIR